MGIQNAGPWVKGYLVLQAEGVFLERFLNICLHRELDIRNVRRLGAERLVCEMSIRSFRQLRPVCFRTKTKAKILKRQGLPFLLYRYRKRKFVVVGILLAMVFFWYTSGHIMGITVLGNEKIPTETILEMLSRSNVALGKSAKNLDSDIIRNQMMRDLDELAWIGINVNGSRVYVEVVERLTPEPRVEKNLPCHLVASRDGVVERVEAKDGQTMVAIGSGVLEGDILVSGVMDNTVTGYRMVHAYGEVFAKTTYQVEGSYPLRFTERRETGKVKKRYSLQILGKKILLYWKKADPYTLFDKKEQNREYRLPVDVIPSLFVVTEEFREQTTEEKTRTVSEILELAEAELEEKAKKEIPTEAEVVERELTHTLTEQGTVEVCLTIQCLENIAMEVPIDQEKTEE